MKYCNLCKTSKGLDQFSIRSKVKGTFESTCKECKREWRKSNKEHIAEYDKYKVGNTNEYIPKTKEKPHLKLVPRKEKRFAREMVSRAVKKGDLVKGPCETCGSTRLIKGHHDDYSKPLVVRWLCPKHHAEWHTIHGEAP